MKPSYWLHVCERDKSGEEADRQSRLRERWIAEFVGQCVTAAAAEEEEEE